MNAEHPDEQTVASYLEGRLEDPALAGFETHLAECDRCRAGLTLLAGDDGTVEPREVETFREAALAVAQNRRDRRRAPRWMLAAAALAIAVVGLLIVRETWPSRPVSSGLERASGNGEVGARSPAAGSQVEAEGLTFRFDAVQGADRYVVIVGDDSGRRIALLEVRAPEHAVRWPADRPLPRGTLVWTVRAMALDRVLSETRPIAFEVP